MDIDIKKGLREAYCFDTDGVTDFYAEPGGQEDNDLAWLDDLCLAYEGAGS
jgi:hypothetical protein